MAEVRRPLDDRAPRTNPAPELLLGVALESPGLCVAAVVAEVFGEHFVMRLHAEELRVVAELGEVIWCRCGRACQFPLRVRERFDQLCSRLAVERLEDA